MEDIKNIESAKARGETFRKMIANKRRNKKYTPNFLEMTIAFLNKTPAEAGLFDASPKSAKGRAASKKATERGKKEAAAKRKMTSAKKSVRRGERDIFQGEDLRKDSKPSTKSYRIVKGDTLSAIAARNDTTVAELKKLNNIKDVNKIFAGKSLKIPTRTMRTPKRKPKKMSNGGALKKPNNPGLAKLPTKVRNRMGFMNKGGVAKKK